VYPHKGLDEKAHEISPNRQLKTTRQNKTRCVYVAFNEEIVRKHAEMNGTPIISITKVVNLWDLTTGEGQQRSGSLI